MSGDDAVRSTNNDAASCKRSAVQLGYWKDPYIQYFIRTGDRKAPEINRGYYARVKGIHTLLKKFLEVTKCQCQIVNLGAGFDTTYWNLKDEGLAPTSFVEVDFQGITAQKAYYVQNRQPLLDKLVADDGEVQFSKTDTDLHSANYHVVAADLRNLSELEAKLRDCGVTGALPTAFVAECVLVYMPSAASSGLLRWITQHFPSAFFVNYEQINMGDRFGEVMIENLKGRGCSLAGVEHCQSLDTQKLRFSSTGWTGVDALDMIQVYKSLPQADVQRFSGPELLNELHNDLFSHYAICWAVHDLQSLGLDRIDLDTKHVVSS